MIYGKLKKRTSGLLAFVGAVIVLGVFNIYQKPAYPFIQTATPIVKQAPTQNVVTPVINRSLPAHLEIPKLKISTNILYTGITKAGAMETPSNAIDVGWYKYGPLPGNSGSAVIAGHIDGTRGEPGVFSGLDKLLPGDTLSVIDDQGRITYFVVRELRTYDQNEKPSEVFGSSEGNHLNLITCTGNWEAAHNRFSKRLVVFTDKSG